MGSNRFPRMRTTRTSVAAVLFACGIACTAASWARAQTTNIVFEAAVNPQSEADWHSSVTAAPGETVFVRMRIRLGGGTALGLAGATTQPTLSRWYPENGDVRREFDAQPVMRDEHQRTGRVFPFASAGMNATSASGILTSHKDPGNILRFGGSKAITATINPAWGVNHAQLTQQLNGTSFATDLDVLVFRYAIELSNTRLEARTMTTGVAAVSQNRGTWYLNAAGTQTLNADIGTITNASIIVTPAPDGITLLAIGGLASVRRRR